MEIFASDRRLKLGVWGLGRGLHIVSTAAAVNIDVVTGCDFNPHFIDLFRKQIPNGRFTDDADEFLKGDFDAVLLATFCPSHADDAIRCLRAGKHVLSEVTAFHTPAEGVRLVEAIEHSGLKYQMAENYPYTPENRWLARRWREGLFGELQYAEYSYIHDCLNLAYTYIDGTPVQPGNTVHNWRSWLPWHYYCTHSLGPVTVITGRRPVEVVAFENTPRLPGHIMEPPGGIAGMAPSLIRMDNGGLVRNLMGGCTDDQDFQRLIGTRGSAAITNRHELEVRLGGRGHSPKFRLRPKDDELGRASSKSGHGGGDFWTLYHFANEILNGVRPPFDIYPASDATLAGIQAYRSAVNGGTPQPIPDLRTKEGRAACRDDHFAPQRFDARALFTKDVEATRSFTAVMKNLLEAADAWTPYAEWSRLHDEMESPRQFIPLARETAQKLPNVQQALRDARDLLDKCPEGEGARVLRETLARFDEKFLLSIDAARVLNDSIEESSKRAEQECEDRVRNVRMEPALEMIRLNFDNLPEIKLPDGYTLRASRGDEDIANWLEIISDSFNEKLDPEAFEKRMMQHAGYAGSTIFFIEDANGEAAATASAFGDTTRGYVHYVGCKAKYTGQKLGYWASLAVLHAFKKRGCADCILTTNDFRLPAIKTYVALGFIPLITDDAHPSRWRQLAHILNQPRLLDWRGAAISP